MMLSMASSSSRQRCSSRGLGNPAEMGVQMTFAAVLLLLVSSKVSGVSPYTVCCRCTVMQVGLYGICICVETHQHKHNKLSESVMLLLSCQDCGYQQFFAMCA
jgi:hypothetical protein